MGQGYEAQRWKEKLRAAIAASEGPPPGTENDGDRDMHTEPEEKFTLERVEASRSLNRRRHRRDSEEPGTEDTETFPRPRLRWRISVRSALICLLIVAGIVALSWGYRQWTLSSAEPLPVAIPTGENQPSDTPARTPRGTDTKDNELIIDITGAVQRPGIVRLPAGSRVFQALEAAGGASEGAQLGALNLAAPLEDGQQIVVLTQEEAARGVPPPAQAAPPASSGNAPGSTGKINLNTASVEQLTSLPRIGPALAQRILEYRQQNGPFRSVGQLTSISGIGPKLLEAIADRVKV